MSFTNKKKRKTNFLTTDVATFESTAEWWRGVGEEEEKKHKKLNDES